VPRQTRTSTFSSLLSDWERQVSGEILARRIYLAGSVKRNQAQPPAPSQGWAEYRVYTGWGVSGLYVMRVKRSASKAAFRKNIIAIYDRLRSKGASRKTARALRSHSSPGNPPRCSAGVSEARESD
jgi:hypothetical protein